MRLTEAISVDRCADYKECRFNGAGVCVCVCVCERERERERERRGDGVGSKHNKTDSEYSNR